MKPRHMALGYSLESVLYQGKSALYADLVAVYRDALAGDTTSLARVAQVVHAHTGMAFTTHLYDGYSLTDYDVTVYFLPFDVNHILRDPILATQSGEHYDLERFRPLLKAGRGSTTRQGTLTGIFTQVPAQLWVTRSLFNGYLSAEELAALTLHEVGHVYNYLDLMGRTVATTLAISETQAILNTTTDLAERTHAIASLVKVFDLSHVDEAALAANEEPEAIQYVLIRDCVSTLMADLGQESLFGAETEFAADGYAVRMGAAAPLGSALVKLAKARGHRQLLTRTTYAAVNATKLAALLVLSIYPPALYVASVVSALVIALTAFAPLNRNTPVERLEAAHGELVAILKDRSLPREKVTELVQDAKYVSHLRESLMDRVGVLNHLWNTLLPSKRRLYNQVQFQRTVSKLVNNELFTKAAELSTMMSS